MPMSDFSTCDLCDAYAEELQIATPLFRDFGGRRAFHGEIVTLTCPEDNSLVRVAVGEPGRGRVMVIDGGGSLRYALMGDMLAAKAVASGWEGVVVHGAVRDVDALAALDLGVRALAACPRASIKRGAGTRNERLEFAGVTFTPGHYLYCDADGLLVARSALPKAVPM
jgi:regulator of ribonuclease activity A